MTNKTIAFINHDIIFVDRDSCVIDWARNESQH